MSEEIRAKCFFGYRPQPNQPPGQSDLSQNSYGQYIYMVWFWFSQALRGRLLRRVKQLYTQKLDTKERNPRCFQDEHKCVLHSRYGGEPHIAQQQIEQNTRERQMGTETGTINKRNTHRLIMITTKTKWVTLTSKSVPICKKRKRYGARKAETRFRTS